LSVPDYLETGAMTVASKINALVILLSLFAGSLLSAYVINREYRVQVEQFRNFSSAEIKSRPSLQLDIYYKDTAALSVTLNRFLVNYAIRYALIRDARGTPLLRESQVGFAPYKLLEFKELRRGISPVEEGYASHFLDQNPEEQGLLAMLTGGEKLFDLTIPVFSAINPLRENVSRSDFIYSMTNPEMVDSLHVIGYVQLGISRSGLLASIAPFAAVVLVIYLLFVFCCGLISHFATRRITAPLARLARMADEVASGETDQNLKIEGSGEIKEIATILNGIIGELHSRKAKMSVNHQLLSMKVDERTSQLSRRNQELNKAVKQVTETKDRLRQLAYFDSLTSLPNRRLFTEQLSLLLKIATRNAQNLALLFLDLDNFKRINDSLGHSAGDLLLREVGFRLSSCIRESDVVAHYVESDGSRIDVSRLGGDEFTVVLNQIENAESAGLVAQRIIDALAEPVTIDGHELVITPSIGIALAPRNASDVEGLLKAADTAMYHAKSSGKNNFLYYDSEMDAANVERLKLETDLRKAIERNELILHYQPQVDTESGSVVGAEALIRWQHPEQGLVPPFKFIPLAEEMGLIGELGDWVLEEACRQTVELKGQGLHLPKVAVNISALQFNAGFIQRVEDVLYKTGLNPAALELELTEGMVMDNSKATIDALKGLKQLGVSLSIDDFGTGYSSLSYLSRFPLDELKIDRSFVIDFDKSDNDASLVIAIIAMGKSMNLNLVAEGVETHEQYRFLTDNGATVIQGYLFSKPVPVEELRPLLAPYHFLNQIQVITDSQTKRPEKP